MALRTSRLTIAGQVAGGVGALLTLTSVITLLFTSDSPLVFGIKLGSGVSLLVFWAITNRARLGSWARSGFFYSSSLVMALLFVALLGAANVLVASHNRTWDLTSKKIYTLAPQTTELLHALHEPVRVIAFVESGVAPEVAEALFNRYRLESEHFAFDFKDPRKAIDLVQKFSIHQGELAAVVVMGDGSSQRHQLLNLSRLANPQLGEQELTNGLLRLQAAGTHKLYFLAGHGEWPLTPLGPGDEAQRASLQIKRVLEEEGYTPESLNLIERHEVPRDAAAVVIAGARTAISKPERKLLEAYLGSGGRVLYFTEPGAQNELDELLSQYAIQVEPGLVADAKVNPDQPFLVITPFFGEHEITGPLSANQLNVVFATTSALTVLREGMLPGVAVKPLVLTTPYAWVELTPSEKPAYDSGERTGQLTLAAAVTRPIVEASDKRSDEARLLIFGDSELLVGAFGLEPNRNLVLNAFAWATQQMKKITIRPPDRELSTIDLPAGMLSTIRLLAMDVLPTALIAIGLSIWLTRRAR